MPAPPIVMAAALLMVFGWGYPHFVETDHWTEYAYAAPFGLLPCPTLSLVMGLTIACHQFGSRVWMLTVGPHHRHDVDSAQDVERRYMTPVTLAVFWDGQTHLLIEEGAVGALLSLFVLIEPFVFRTAFSR